MMVRVLLILFCLLFAGNSFSIEGVGYNYDVITTLSEEMVDSYDGRSNYIIECGIYDIENSSEKIRDGSFFVFEIGLVATKGAKMRKDTGHIFDKKCAYSNWDGLISVCDKRSCWRPPNENKYPE
jgi:hypothetical protein